MGVAERDKKRIKAFNHVNLIPKRPAHKLLLSTAIFMNFASSISHTEQLITHGPIHCHFNEVTTWLLRA
jgi:hypothetical protein